MDSAILVHASLREVFASLDNGRDGISGSERVEFVDDGKIDALDDISDPIIFLPVHTERQGDRVHEVRSRQPAAVIVAVTNDVTGHPTHYAIRSGADLVVNLAIADRRQQDVIRWFTTGTRNLPARAAGGSSQSGEAPVRASVSQISSLDPMIRGRSLGVAESELVGMLLGSMTVAEIARSAFISERSMYRRIRALYRRLGVNDRAELRRSMGGFATDLNAGTA